MYLCYKTKQKLLPFLDSNCLVTLLFLVLCFLLFSVLSYSFSFFFPFICLFFAVNAENFASSFYTNCSDA